MHIFSFGIVTHDEKVMFLDSFVSEISEEAMSRF